jgi:hypothetical protein
MWDKIHEESENSSEYELQHGPYVKRNISKTNNDVWIIRIGISVFFFKSRSQDFQYATIYSPLLILIVIDCMLGVV